MRPAIYLLPAVLALACPTGAQAETTVEYGVRQGYSSNLFQDTYRLRGVFTDIDLGLRGSMGPDDSKLSYALIENERRVPTYRFGDIHATGAQMGYQTKLSDALEIAIEAAITRQDAGDLLLSVADINVGYRTVDYNYQAALRAATTVFGGKTSLEAQYGYLDKGTAKFTLAGVNPVKLDPDVGEFILTGKHIIAAAGGEIGVTGEYRKTNIPLSDQFRLGRLPGMTLRGSLAYGRTIGQFAFLADIGMTALASRKAGGDTMYQPYLKTEIQWKPSDRFALGAGYTKNTVLNGIDDAVAELVRTYTFAATGKITSAVSARLAYEIASNEYCFYQYRTRTRKITSGISVDLTEAIKLDFDYTRVLRNESDPAQAYHSNEISARIHGKF